MGIKMAKPNKHGSGWAALLHPAPAEEASAPQGATGPALPPEVAVVECDGGRIRTRRRCFNVERPPSGQTDV
jgi:hypothetical protein